MAWVPVTPSVTAPAVSAGSDATMTPACTPNAPSAALSGPASMLKATARCPDAGAWACAAAGHSAAAMTPGRAQRSAALKAVLGKGMRTRDAARTGREDMNGFPGS